MQDGRSSAHCLAWREAHPHAPTPPHARAARAQVTLPAAPSAIVDGATFDGILINITAGTPAPLVANRSVCEAGPCTYSW